MENQVTVQTADALEVLNRSEVDMQIATAKRYPRDLNKALNQIKMIAAHDPQTAAECFYSVPRKDGGNWIKIEGLSVRMAEIIAGAWGNLRVASRIIGNDGKMITAQAVCIDLENNLAISKEVKRRITNKEGKTFTEDMQVTTGNAACSIAFRNAVLAVVPKAVTKQVIDEIKAVAIGQAMDVSTMREKTIAWFAGKGVKEKDLLEWCELTSREELTQEKLFELRGLCNAINDGSTSLEESIIEPLRQARSEKEAKKKGGENASKVMASMKKASK